jgi:hypothetical protein
MAVVSSGFAEEFVGIDFNDKRLSDRIIRIAESLGRSCNLSIPAAVNGRAEMEAVYRFVENPKVNPQKLTSRHREATLERIEQCEVVLLVQDTTELDVTRPSEQVDGSGPLEYNSRRGSFYHPLLAFNAEGLALGTVWNKHWVRESIQTNRTAAEKRKDNRDKAIEEKESVRWLEGVRAALEVARECPHTKHIVMGDSEADIYEVLAEPRVTDDGRQLELIVRAARDRNLADPNEKLLATVRGTPCLYRSTVDVSKRREKTNVKSKSPRQRARDARQAEVEVRAAKVTIRCPCKGPRRPSLTYNVVLVEEPTPPAGEDPIQWVLLTSLSIDTIEEVQQIVAYYCHRWQIEIYFRVLKSGCRIQERYFETMYRLENCLAIYIVIAWKILYLCRLGRDCPDLPCDLVFSDSEWKAVYAVANHEPPPRETPTINEMIRLIATLGGYVNRKTTHPGTQTLWIGLQRVYDLARAWDTFGPDSRFKKSSA